jgi:hypothetical protein
MISIALIYGYISTILFLQGQTQPSLIVLDRLLLLRAFSPGVGLHAREAKMVAVNRRETVR